MIKYKVECDEILKWNLVKNGKIIETKIGKKEEFNFDILEEEFYRVEGCELEESRVVVYINPIYNGIKFNKRNTWKKIKKNVSVELSTVCSTKCFPMLLDRFFWVASRGHLLLILTLFI